MKNYDNFFLPSGDLKKGKAFYQDLLGLQVKFDFSHMGMVAFKVGDNEPANRSSRWRRNQVRRVARRARGRTRAFKMMHGTAGYYSGHPMDSLSLKKRAGKGK